MFTNESKPICKYFSSGFCKFRHKCLFEHVLEECKTKECDKRKCLKRHPKKCKFFFLRSFCKFKSESNYSHDIDLEDKELKAVRLEIETISKENKVIQLENEELKHKIDKMEEEMKKIREEVKIQEKESSKLKIENLEIKEINETLIEDLTFRALKHLKNH